MSTYDRPLPTITPNNRPFWEAAARHELVIPRCQKCAHTWFPPGPVCPYCMSNDFIWQKSAGRGRVSSWVIYNKVYYDGFADAIPYNVVQVELEDGPRLTSNLVGVANSDIKYEMKVEVIFDDVAPGVTIPKFRPAS